MQVNWDTNDHRPPDHGENLQRIADSLPQQNDFQNVSELLKQLSDPSRSRIYWVLCHCEECVINIAAMVDMSSPAVSHHLRQLKTGGLIVSRRKGKEVYYRAADTEQAQALHHMIERMITLTCPTEEDLHDHD